jgi:exodeoxyribonuclease VIII
MLKRKWTPNTVGAFESLEADTYHAAPGLSKSMINVFRECPAKYKATLDGKIERRETKAMQYGTLLHAAILENLFDYHVRPAEVNGKEWHSSRNDCKEWTAAHQDLPIVSADQDDEIRMVARTVRKHPLAWQLIKNSRREVSLFAEYGGRLMKGRVDALNPDGWICDIKKVADASTRELERSVVKYGHHLQAGLYWKLCQILGIRCDAFYFIAIELGATVGDTPLLNVRKLSPIAMEAGLRDVEKSIVEIAECEASGVWPDYSGVEVGEISIPEWAMPEPDLEGYEEAKAL